MVPVASDILGVLLGFIGSLYQEVWGVEGLREILFARLLLGTVRFKAFYKA